MNDLPRTTITHMHPASTKNRYKYCFEMRHYGANERVELELWCKEDPTRQWGNMGYVECQRDEDAIYMINTYGINVNWTGR